MQPIRAQHPSMRGKSILPHKFTRHRLTDEQITFIDNYAIGIFTDAVNAGHTFQAALAAVYLSGLQNGQAFAQGNGDEHKS